MDILFTWKDYEPLPKERTACINVAHEMYPDSKIIVITDIRDKFPDYVEFIKLETVRDSLINTYDVNPARLRNYYGITDYARFWYLSRYANTLYLDTDTQCIKKIPELKSGLCGACPNQLDVLYNNDSPKTFEMCFSERKDSSNLMHLTALFDFEKEFIDLSEYFTHRPEALGFKRNPKLDKPKTENKKEVSK